MNQHQQIKVQQNSIYLKLDYDMNSVPNFVILPTPEDYKKYYVEK